MSQALAEVASASGARSRVDVRFRYLHPVRWDKPSFWQEPAVYGWVLVLGGVFGAVAGLGSGSVSLAILATVVGVLSCFRIFLRESFQVDETGIHWWYGRRGYRFIGWGQVAGWKISDGMLFVIPKLNRSPSASARVFAIPLPADEEVSERIRSLIARTASLDGEPVVIRRVAALNPSPR